MSPSVQALLADEEAFTQPLTAERPHGAHLCVACGNRPARFQYRGVVKADRSHTLCFQCYRSTLDSVRNVERVPGAMGWFSPTVLPPAVDRALGNADEPAGSAHALRLADTNAGVRSRGAASARFERSGGLAGFAREPHGEKYEELARRRRRAQMAARHALGLD